MSETIQEYNVTDFDVIVHKESPFTYGIVYETAWTRDGAENLARENQLNDENASQTDPDGNEGTIEDSPDTNDEIDSNDDDASYDEDLEEYSDDDSSMEDFMPLAPNQVEANFGPESNVAVNYEDITLIDRPMEEGNMCSYIDQRGKQHIGLITKAYPIYDLVFFYTPRKLPSSSQGRQDFRRHILLPSVPGHFIQPLYEPEWRDHYGTLSRKSPHDSVVMMTETASKYTLKINANLIISFTQAKTETMVPVSPFVTKKYVDSIAYRDEFAYYPGQHVAFEASALRKMHFIYEKGSASDLVVLCKKSKRIRGVIIAVEPTITQIQPLVCYDELEEMDALRSDINKIYQSRHLECVVLDRCLVHPLVMNILPHFHVGENKQEWHDICEFYQHIQHNDRAQPNMEHNQLIYTTTPQINPHMYLQQSTPVQISSNTGIDAQPGCGNLLASLLSPEQKFPLLYSNDITTVIAHMDEFIRAVEDYTTSSSRFATKIHPLIGDDMILPLEPFTDPSHVSGMYKTWAHTGTIGSAGDEPQQQPPQDGDDTTEKAAIYPEKVNTEWKHRSAFVYRQLTAVTVQWADPIDVAPFPDQHEMNDNQHNIPLSTHRSTTLTHYTEIPPYFAGHWATYIDHEKKTRLPCVIIESNWHHKVAKIKLFKKKYACYDDATKEERAAIDRNDENVIVMTCGCIYVLYDDIITASYYELSRNSFAVAGKLVLCYEKHHHIPGLYVPQSQSKFAAGVQPGTQQGQGEDDTAGEHNIDDDLQTAKDSSSATTTTTTTTTTGTEEISSSMETLPVEAVPTEEYGIWSGVILSNGFGYVTVQWANGVISNVHPSSLHCVEDDADTELSYAVERDRKAHEQEDYKILKEYVQEVLGIHVDDESNDEDESNTNDDTSSKPPTLPSSTPLSDAGTSPAATSTSTSTTTSSAQQTQTNNDTRQYPVHTDVPAQHSSQAQSPLNTDGYDDVIDEDAMEYADAQTAATLPPTTTFTQGQRSASKLSQFHNITLTTPPKSFQIEQSVSPTWHAFWSSTTPSKVPLKTLQHEYKLLQRLSPADGIFVIAYAARSDLFTIMIQGSKGTPFYGGIFTFDMHLTAKYPDEPPKVRFVSQHGQSDKIHPNLYIDGHICLSLLNTWSGELESQRWNPQTSSLYQICLSLSGIILGIPDPFFSEANYDVKRLTKQGELDSIQFNERSVLGSLSIIANSGLTSLVASNTGGYTPILQVSSRCIANVEYYHLLATQSVYQQLFSNAFDSLRLVEQQTEQYLDGLAADTQHDGDKRDVYGFQTEDQLRSLIASLPPVIQQERQVMELFALPPEPIRLELIANQVYYPSYGFSIQLKKVAQRIVNLYKALGLPYN